MRELITHIMEADVFKGPSKDDLEARGIKSDSVLYTDGGDKINIRDISEEEIIYWHDLTDEEKEDLDYIDPEDGGSFFRYRGDINDMGNFMRVEIGGPFARAGWQGIHGSGYWNATIIAINDSGDGVKVARATW